MSSPPGTSFRSARVLFFTNFLAMEAVDIRHLGTTLLALCRAMRLLLKILRLHAIDLLSINLSAKICSTRVLLVKSLETTSPSSARLHCVAAFLVDAMATSADTFIAFLLSKIVAYFLLLHIWSPFIHFFRNSRFSDDEPHVLRLLIHSSRKIKSIIECDYFSKYTHSKIVWLKEKRMNNMIAWRYEAWNIYERWTI